MRQQARITNLSLQTCATEFATSTRWHYKSFQLGANSSGNFFSEIKASLRGADNDGLRKEIVYTLQLSGFLSSKTPIQKDSIHPEQKNAPAPSGGVAE